MRQTTLCVPLEVRPESCSRLTDLVDRFREREDKGVGPGEENFARVQSGMPTLHFMSMSVFAAREYDPLFVIEANFDGEPGPFWGQMEAAFGDDLREMLRCCKRPLTDDGELYDAVTARGSVVSVAAYLQARTQRPSVFHHGNRGLTRDAIRNEHALFRAVRDALDGVGHDGPSPYRGIPGPEVHARLRAAMLPAFPWLTEPAPERVGARERALDVLRLAAFAVVVLLALTLPGIALAALMPTRAYLVLLALAALAGGAGTAMMWKALPGTAVPTRFSLPRFLLRSLPMLAAGVAIYLVCVTVLLVLLAWPGSIVLAWAGAGPPIDPRAAFAPVGRAVLLGLLSLPVVLLLLLAWLRWLERRDSSHDGPPVEERLLHDMIRREDWVAQNHMGSIVLIRPGILRSIIIRAGHLGLHLVLRLTATDGYLGSMRTVHFAHWAFLNNGSRLLFLSNFDHSWDSYLDDFIEKAHVGLTLAWGCGVGFPPTRFLIHDGASHGRRFKAWALSSRAVSRFWYSAYPKLTVNQIERNHAIASGLRQRRLSDGEARTWMAHL